MSRQAKQLPHCSFESTLPSVVIPQSYLAQRCNVRVPIWCQGWTSAIALQMQLRSSRLLKRWLWFGLLTLLISFLVLFCCFVIIMMVVAFLGDCRVVVVFFETLGFCFWNLELKVRSKDWIPRDTQPLQVCSKAFAKCVSVCSGSQVSKIQYLHVSWIVTYCLTFSLERHASLR